MLAVAAVIAAVLGVVAVQVAVAKVAKVLAMTSVVAAVLALMVLAVMVVVMMVMLAMVLLVVDMQAVAMVEALAVVAEMETAFSSQSPPQLPGAKHPALAPVRIPPGMRYVSHWRLQQLPPRYRIWPDCITSACGG